MKILLLLLTPSCITPNYLEVSGTYGGQDVDGLANGAVIDYEDPYYSGTVTVGWYLRDIPTK